MRVKKPPLPPPSPVDDSKGSKFFNVSPVRVELGGNGDNLGSEDSEKVNQEEEEEDLIDSEMAQKLNIDDTKNSEHNKSNANYEDEQALSSHDKSDLRDENAVADSYENNENLENEISINENDETINLREDISLEINDSTSIGDKIEIEIDEEGNKGYKELLKFESPSLEKLLSEQDLDLSYIEKTANTSPLVIQEDSGDLKEKTEKSERVSRADSKNKQGIITRSKSLCGRFNDEPSVGLVNSSEQKTSEEKPCA